MTYRHPNRQRATYKALVRWFGNFPLRVVAKRVRECPSWPLITNHVDPYSPLSIAEQVDQ